MKHQSQGECPAQEPPRLHRCPLLEEANRRQRPATIIEAPARVKSRKHVNASRAAGGAKYVIPYRRPGHPIRHRHVPLGSHRGNGGSYTLSRSSYSHLWRLGVLVAALAATPATWADPLSAVEVLRAGGCGGVMPAAQPLRHNPMLDRAAAEWATGQSLPSASERNGYRGDFTAGLHIHRPDSATLQLLRRSGCRMVAGREMRDIGVYRRGFDSWLVVASIYKLPPWLQASTETLAPSPGPPLAPALPPATAMNRVPPLSPPASSWDTPATPLPALPAAPSGGPAGDSLADRSVTRAPVPTPALSPSLATRALQLVNDVRARGTHCGDELFGPAPPVALSGTLANVARGHARDMAEKNTLEHIDTAE